MTMLETKELSLEIASLEVFQPFLEFFCGGSLNKFNIFSTVFFIFFIY